MNSDSSTEGQLFSRVYLQRSEPIKDSTRFRTRINAYFTEHFSKLSGQFALAVQRELGITVPVFETKLGGYQWNILAFFNNAELRDLLDSVSVITSLLDDPNWRFKRAGWLSFVRRALQKEGMGYRVDDAGGVRYLVDDEYEKNRFSSIACLNNPKYGAVMDLVESAYSKLDREPVDTKGSIRDIFEAAETLSKLITATNQDLTEAFVKKNLKPLAQQCYGPNDNSAMSVADQMLESLSHWVNSGHRYRHGQKAEEPIAPPMGLAILYISAGATFIRWLVELDGAAT